MPTTFTIGWDTTGTRKYESGIDRGVLYKRTGSVSGKEWVGVAWNGLTSVSESPEGADKTDLWADNIKYASFRAAENFGGTIEAYTYPPEFESCNGEGSLATGAVAGQQSRDTFRFCYRTKVGNDQSQDLGYKIHLIYDCTCSPSERSYETINDSPDAITFSWEFDSTPVAVTGSSTLKPTSVITVDSTTATSTGLAALEAALYGDGTAVPYMPDPADVITLLSTV